MHGRFVLAALLFALAAFFGFTSGTHRGFAAPPPTAVFDWAMPSGLQDQDGDGLIDEYFNDSHAPANLNPTTWTVNFDACDSVEGSSEIVEYRWAIDSEDAGTSASCDGFSHEFPTEGVYEVVLTVIDLEAQESSVAHDVTVQDWLIVSLGDSYGSGEGNPDVPIPPIAFDNYNAALADLEEAQADLDSAIADLLHVEALYTVTLERGDAVRDAQTALNSAEAARNFRCNPFNFPFVGIPGTDEFDNCANAIVSVNIARANLLSALAEMGLQALIDTGNVINEALNDAAAAALAAVNVAQSAVNVAQALVTDAQTALTNAIAGATATWQDTRCHRSAIAGSAQAALLVEKSDPRTSVSFVHLACSGAKITTGLISGYEGMEPAVGEADLPPQLQATALLLDGREIDAMYVSIGGNDANFAPIVESCITQDQCHTTPTIVQTGIDGILNQICLPLSLYSSDCTDYFEEMKTDTKSGLEYYTEGISMLDGLYVDLGDEIAAQLPDLPADRVYLSEYPNATQGDTGAYCPDPNDPNPLASLPGISLAETTWADQTVTVQLNQAVAHAASLDGEGWNLIGGIYSGFANHGYCAVDHWLVRIQESFFIQGNHTGSVHPTADGHGVYRDQIFASLMDDFYPAGNLNAPRPPVTQEEPAEPIEVTDELEQVGELRLSYDPTPVANAPGGVYTISGTGINVSDTSFVEVIFVAASLTEGCVFLNADGGMPQGAGATLTLSGDDFGDDGILSPGESFTSTVHVGLATSPHFQLSYEVWAVPAP